MTFTLEQALSKIGTAEYSGVASGENQILARPICPLIAAQKSTHKRETMVFKNEQIPEQDRAEFESVINYENLKKQAPYITEFRSDRIRWWTIDRERGVYVLDVIGGGREQLPYGALVIDSKAIVFNFDKKIKGSDSIGLEEHWDIYDLRIPAELESRREEIKQLIREGLEEMAYWRPFADGGTVANPNAVARANIISIEIEFK
jgi:hypothetical protein